MAGSGAGWSLTKITDASTLGGLTELFTPPEETRSSMGRGRDASPHHKKYTRLVIKHAWEAKVPLQHAYYEAKRKEIKQHLEKIGTASEEGARRTDPTPTLTDAVGERLGMDAACNEKLLLHGTKVKVVVTILSNGVDERYTTRAAFGFGAYFAEDPSKIDQYAEADRGESADEEVKHLHGVLYGASEDPHPGEVFYAFVCQVFLGCPIYTKGPASPAHPTSVRGPTDSCAEGVQVFANDLKRQLIAIPGTFPQIPYHSLVVLKGPDSAVERHREFVIFDGKAVLPKYLVAYAREE